jgi:DNA topoisomerase-1
VDNAGTRRCIDSADVNRYLRDIAGQPFTAKNFRTWAATVLAAKAVCALPDYTSESAFKRHVLSAIDSVAAKLGNTRAVCRGSYIHSGVLEGYRSGQTIATVRSRPRMAGLSAEEGAVLAFLKRRPRQTRREKIAA